MKRNKAIRIIVTITIPVVIIYFVCGYMQKGFMRDVINPPFSSSSIYPTDDAVSDSVIAFNVNGVEFKMVEVKGGKICCEGFRDTIKLDDFYIGETEVTQELWAVVMGSNPSMHKGTDNLPVENIDLVDCLTFVHKLDSISGMDFYIPSYPQWLYAAILGSNNSSFYGSEHLGDVGWYRGNSSNTTHQVKTRLPNRLGIYDMTGNVAEWSISGSDPLFHVMGASYESDEEHCKFDMRELDHANVKTSSLGMRLILHIH